MGVCMTSPALETDMRSSVSSFDWPQCWTKIGLDFSGVRGQERKVQLTHAKHTMLSNSHLGLIKMKAAAISTKLHRVQSRYNPSGPTPPSRSSRYKGESYTEFTIISDFHHLKWGLIRLWQVMARNNPCLDGSLSVGCCCCCWWCHKTQQKRLTLHSLPFSSHNLKRLHKLVKRPHNINT